MTLDEDKIINYVLKADEVYLIINHVLKADKKVSPSNTNSSECKMKWFTLENDSNLWQAAIGRLPGSQGSLLLLFVALCPGLRTYQN